MTNRFKEFLKTIKLTSETINTLMPILRGIGILIAVILLVMMVNTYYFDKKEQAYLTQMREFKEQAEIASKYADSVKVQVATQDSVAKAAVARAAAAEIQARKSKNTTNTLRQELDSLRETVTDSIEMARVIIPKQDSIITQQEITISKQDTQIVSLNIAVEAKDSALVLSNIRGDSLQTVVNNIPAPPKPPLIPKITRKQAFIGGTVVGIILKMFVFKG